MFPGGWNKVAASHIFPVDFILFPFSYYFWEIVNILIYWTKYGQKKIFCVKTFSETKSIEVVQSRYRRKLHFNTFLKKSQISKLVKNFEVHGNFENCKATGSSPFGPPTTIDLVGWVFASGPGDLGSFPGRVIPKTLKRVLDTALLNTQQYKVRIKSKVGQSRERRSTVLGVVGIEKKALGSPLTTVANFTYFCPPYSSVSSIERWTSEVCRRGFLWTFWVHAWD